jgi:hypothetical protein
MLVTSPHLVGPPERLEGEQERPLEETVNPAVAVE